MAKRGRPPGTMSRYTEKQIVQAKAELDAEYGKPKSLKEAIALMKAVQKDTGKKAVTKGDYEREVNKLIPTAVKMANAAMVGVKNLTIWKPCISGKGVFGHDRWTIHFHDAMARLTKSRGLRA